MPNSPLKEDILRADGFSSNEIAKINAKWREIPENEVDNSPAIIVVGSTERIVCRSIAKIVDSVRPGSWQ